MRHFNWQKSVVFRKALRYALLPQRLLCSVIAPVEQYARQTPVVANSFPKSGTNLLIQVLAGLSKTKSYGNFIASTPTIPFRERPKKSVVRSIRRIMPGELVAAHTHYEKDYEVALEGKKAVHYFIYRDLRDVAVSEAYYLTFMNRWHRLHKHFQALPSMEERILFAISGTDDPEFPYDYPDIARRFARYAGWLQCRDVFAVRFEDLVDCDKQEKTIAEMVNYYMEKSQRTLDQNHVIKNALLAMNPQKSHTFRRGQVGGWQHELSLQNRKAFNKVAGGLLVELGYELGSDWAKSLGRDR